MKTFLSVLVPILLFFTTTNFGMDTEILCDSSVGLFGTLPRDISYPMVAKLKPRTKNNLRKTCKAFNKLLSFCNPSAFVAREDFCASEKDMEAVFTGAVFDKNYSLVEALHIKISSSHIIHPCTVALINNDQTMLDLLGKYDSRTGWVKDPQVLEYYRQNPLYNLCVLRNSERVKRVMEYNRFRFNLSDDQVQSSLSIIIDNDDVNTFEVIREIEDVKNYIQQSCHALLQLIVWKQRLTILEAFIATGWCDLNKNGPDEMRKWFGYGSPMAEFSRTLLDHVYTYEHLLKQKNSLKHDYITTLLINNGAQTSQQLEEKICMVM